MRLRDASRNIGRKVLYTPFSECSRSQLEVGVIVRVSRQYVSVRYGKDVNVKSTRARDLILLHTKEEETK